MSRGGYRKNAGRQSQWKNKGTKSIRVPKVLAEQILNYAHKIDNGDVFEEEQLALFKIETSVKENCVIDLYGVNLTPVKGQLGVKISDLIKKGYSVIPEYINDTVTESMKRNR